MKTIHQLFKDLLTLCAAFIKKIEIKEGAHRRHKHQNKDDQLPSERQQISILSTSPS